MRNKLIGPVQWSCFTEQTMQWKTGCTSDLWSLFLFKKWIFTFLIIKSFINHYIPKIRIWTKVELMEIIFKMFQVRPLSISHSRPPKKDIVGKCHLSSSFSKKPAKLCSFLWIDYSKKICLKYLLGEYFSSFFQITVHSSNYEFTSAIFFTESLLHTRHCQKGRKMSSDKKPF